MSLPGGSELLLCPKNLRDLTPRVRGIWKEDGEGHKGTWRFVAGGRGAYTIVGRRAHDTVLLGASAAGEDVEVDGDVDALGSLNAIDVQQNGTTAGTLPALTDIRGGGLQRLHRLGTYYVTDHLGTVRAVYQAEPHYVTLSPPVINFWYPRMLSTHDYEPFGVELFPNDYTANTHQYTGHERDTGTTRNDYMHARFYGASLGRFMRPDSGVAQDPTNPQSWNLYSYVKNNPVNLNDPTGHEDEGVLAESLGKEQEAVIQGTMTEKQFIDTQAARAAGAAAGLVVDLTIVNPSAGVEAAKGLYSLLKGDVAGALEHGLKSIEAIANGQSNDADQAQPRDTAQQIAEGHSYKHVEAGEFKGISGKEQWAQHIRDVISHPSAEKELDQGRHAFVDQKSGTVVVVDPNHADKGTAWYSRDPEKRLKTLH